MPNLPQKADVTITDKRAVLINGVVVGNVINVDISHDLHDIGGMPRMTIEFAPTSITYGDPKNPPTPVTEVDIDKAIENARRRVNP